MQTKIGAGDSDQKRKHGMNEGGSSAPNAELRIRANWMRTYIEGHPCGDASDLHPRTDKPAQ